MSKLLLQATEPAQPDRHPVRRIPTSKSSTPASEDQRLSPASLSLPKTTSVIRGYPLHHGWLSQIFGSSFTNTAYDNDGFNNRSQSRFEPHKNLRGSGDFDQPHAFLALGSYLIPYGGKRIGRWSINSVYLSKTGAPFGLKTGSDAPGFVNVDGISGDLPNLLDPSILSRTIGNPDQSRQLLPKSAFAFIPVGQLAVNLGRNVFRRSHIRNWNASLNLD